MAESGETVAALKTKLGSMLGRASLRLSVAVVPKAADAAPPPPTSNAAKDPKAAAASAAAAAAAAQPQFAVLEDTALLEQLGLADDSVVYFSFPIDGQQDAWENVQIVEFEPLDDAMN
ncbi:hypothetical protein HDU99_010123 [Rhizoclosmatium hyalinum]|nr:hypothetical protein HDU99_010123 [Rhizoclosmatium hyalinum]